MPRLIQKTLAYLGLMLLPHGAQADVVTDWNRVAVAAAGSLGGGTGVQVRVISIAHIALFDAINGVEPRFQALLSSRPLPEVCQVKQQCLDASASLAAYGVLIELVPLRKIQLDQALKAALDAIPEGSSKQLGTHYGMAIAADVLAARKNDGSELSVRYSPSNMHGRWSPTPPDKSPAAVPHFGRVKPFTMRAVNQFSLAGPPAFDSPEYRRDLQEVREKGASRHSSRTADQSESALFWNILTHLPINQLALGLSLERKLSVHENARLFALLHALGADSQIATWHWKYHFDAWRPISALRSGADADWLSLIYSPSHPEYPSGHAAYGGAVVEVLKNVFGTEHPHLELTNPWSTMTRRYASFEHIAQDLVDSRVWAGVHFRTTDEHSRELGRQIAIQGLGHWMRVAPTP